MQLSPHFQELLEEVWGSDWRSSRKEERLISSFKELFYDWNVSSLQVTYRQKKEKAPNITHRVFWDDDELLNVPNYPLLEVEALVAELAPKLLPPKFGWEGRRVELRIELVESTWHTGYIYGDPIDEEEDEPKVTAKLAVNTYYTQYREEDVRYDPYCK